MKMSIAPETKDPAALVRAALWIGALCFGLRVADVFLIRSDTWLGELILSKVLGLAIVLGYAIWSGYGLNRIGFRKISVVTLVSISFVLTALVMATTFLTQFLFLSAQGAGPIFTTGAQGSALSPQNAGTSVLFSITKLLALNLVNATMEESLFRGLVLTHLAAAMSRMRANAVQAILFGLWHIVWPLRAVIDGDMATSEAMSYGAGYILVATLMGFVWGCFFVWFKSLWVGIFAHTFQNAALNVFHITTAAGGTGLAFFTTVEAFIFMALLPLVYRLAKSRRG